MESLKRQSLVIDAMAHVQSGVQLVLVGKGPDEPQLRAQVERLGVGDRVRMEIAVSDDRLYQLYQGALAVYYGPFDEDYGYVTLEGFAAERPVVTLTRQRRPAGVRRGRRDGPRVRARPQGDRRRRSTGCSPTVMPRARMGRAGHALVRAEVPRWPDVVARLLD